MFLYIRSISNSNCVALGQGQRSKFRPRLRVGQLNQTRYTLTINLTQELVSIKFGLLNVNPSEFRCHGNMVCKQVCFEGPIQVETDRFCLRMVFRTPISWVPHIQRLHCHERPGPSSRTNSSWDPCKQPRVNVKFSTK